MHQILLVF